MLFVDPLTITLLGFGAAVLALPTPTDSADVDLSNSERLARGLPLGRPRTLFDATKPRALVARASGTISAPATTSTSSVKVSYYYPQTGTGTTKREVGESSLGKLYPKYEAGIYALTDDESLASQFYYTSDDATGTSVALGVSDSYTTESAKLNIAAAWVTYSHHYEGAAYDNVGNGGKSCIGLVKTDSASAGNYSSKFSMIQSTIWSAPASGAEMVFTWTNEDKTTIQPNFYWDPTNNLIRMGAQASDREFKEEDRVVFTYA